MRKVLLLGASGNIGVQSLDIFEADRSSFELVGISVGKQTGKIEPILKRFPSIKGVYCIDEGFAKDLKEKHPELDVFSGENGLSELIKNSDADMVENALVGFSGLVPSVTALQENKILCLANKESLVVGGDIINKLLDEGHGKMWPIDSEHVAIAKCFSKVNPDDVEKILLTGSGGAFRNLKIDELDNVTPEMALHHPTWNMGAKITIDSDTMMNKGFEIIEAHHLFRYDVDKVEVILHDESNLHSALLLKDGTIVGDVSKPDMHGPIAYALYEGKAPFEVFKVKKLEDFGPFHFHKFNPERYPAVPLCIKALKMGGTATAVINAANEVAIALFLERKIRFSDIVKVNEMTLSHFTNIMNPTLTTLVKVDKEVRQYVRATFEKGVN